MWMTSNWSSFEPSGARAAFTAMRLLWLMTSVVSGHPGLEGKSSLSLALACSSVGHASSPTRSHFTKLKMPGSERMFSVSSCLCPPARSRTSWLCSNGALMGRPAQESSTAGNCRKSPSSRNFTSAFSPTHAMSSCVISSTTSQPSFCALPPRTCLRTQWSAVCAPSPRFALLSQPRNNGPGQVRLSGARQAREQQGVARQAVAYRVVHPTPPPLFGPLRLHARRPAAQQRLRLFHAVDRRAVRVAQRLQRPQPLREALRQPLRQQTVRLHRGGASRMRRALATMQCSKPSTADGAVGAVAQQPPRVDKVPHHAPLVGEGLREVRARTVQLAAAAAHAVDHLRAARPQAYHRLAMCSSPLHAASMRSSARRSVAASTWLRAEMPNTMWFQRQTPRSSIAASETFGYQPGPTYGNRFRQDCLAWQQPSTKPRSVHGLNAVRRAQDGQGEGGVGQPVAPAAHHVHADVQRVLCARLRLKNQRRDVLHAALQTRGLRALSQRRTAPAKFARCPQRPASPAPRVQLAAAAAQRDLPSCAARVFCLRRAGHLRLSLSPHCAGLLMATLGLSPAGPAARPRRQSTSTLGWAAGSASPRPGSTRAACLSNTRFGDHPWQAAQRAEARATSAGTGCR